MDDDTMTRQTDDRRTIWDRWTRCRRWVAAAARWIRRHVRRWVHPATVETDGGETVDIVHIGSGYRPPAARRSDGGHVVDDGRRRRTGYDGYQRPVWTTDVDGRWMDPDRTPYRRSTIDDANLRPDTFQDFPDQNLPASPDNATLISRGGF